MKTIISSEYTVLLEITQKCYSGCPWCYKCSQVGPKQPHLPLKTILGRLAWIDEHIDCDDIYLIGGEPLLHPDFSKIIRAIFSYGKKARIITSGNISKTSCEQANYHEMLDLYEQGMLQVELSFQAGINEKAYKRTMDDLVARYEKRRGILGKKSEYTQEVYDLHSTVVLDESYVGNWERFIDLVERVIKLSYLSNPSKKDMISLKEHHVGLGKHFAPFEQSKSKNFTISPTIYDEGFLAKMKFSGKIGISEIYPGSQISVVQKPRSGKCDVMKVEMIGETLISLPSILIRTDGDVTFAKPECITALHGLCNVDVHTTSDQIYEAIKSSIEEIKRSIITGKRNKAASPNTYCMDDIDYPQESDKAVLCTSCPFDFSCNYCHLEKEGW